MLSVAEHLAAAGRTVDAVESVDLLLATGLAGTTRTRALMLRCVLEHDIEAAGRILEEALDHVGDDTTRRAHLLLLLSSHHLYREHLDLTASEGAAREALAMAERVRGSGATRVGARDPRRRRRSRGTP